jgi:hypothetical protein
LNKNISAKLLSFISGERERALFWVFCMGITHVLAPRVWAAPRAPLVLVQSVFHKDDVTSLRFVAASRAQAHTVAAIPWSTVGALIASDVLTPKRHVMHLLTSWPELTRCESCKSLWSDGLSKSILSCYDSSPINLCRVKFFAD